MKNFIYKLLQNDGLSTKRFLAIIGTICLCIYTIIYADATPITSVVISAIGGNVAEKYIANKVANVDNNDQEIK